MQKRQEKGENNHDLVSCAGKAEQVHEGRRRLRVFGRGRCGAAAAGRSLHAVACDFFNVGTFRDDGGCCCLLRDHGGCSRAGGGFEYCNKIGRGGHVDMLVEVQRIVSGKRKRRSGRRRRTQRRYLNHLNGRHCRILRALLWCQTFLKAQAQSASISAHFRSSTCDTRLLPRWRGAGDAVHFAPPAQHPWPRCPTASEA